MSLAESQQALERTVKALSLAEEKQKSIASINVNLSEKLAANEKLLNENEELKRKLAPSVAKLEAGTPSSFGGRAIQKNVFRGNQPEFQLRSKAESDDLPNPSKQVGV